MILKRSNETSSIEIFSYDFISFFLETTSLDGMTKPNFNLRKKKNGTKVVELEIEGERKRREEREKNKNKIVERKRKKRG